MQPLLFLFEFIFTCWIGQVFFLSAATQLWQCALWQCKKCVWPLSMLKICGVYATLNIDESGLCLHEKKPMFSLACEQWIGLFRLQNRFIICFSVSTRFLWLVLDCRNKRLFCLPKSLLSLFELTNCRTLIDNVLHFKVRTQDS